MNTNVNWFNSSTISPAPSAVLNLFDDVTATAVLESATSTGPERMVLRGRVANEKGSYFLLATESNVVSGSIFIPNRGSWKVECAENGLHRIVEQDPAQVPPCGAKAPEPGSPSPNSFSPKQTATETANGGGAIFSIVDVMVLYTPQARDGAGGEAAIETMIDLAVAEANMTYQNSGVNLVLRLAGTAKVPYQDSGDISLDLSRLINPADGYLDEVGALRTACNADLVCLLVENSSGGVSGVATVTANRTNAFSVVQRPWAVGSYVFAHELGHNFGCQHDRANANTAGAYSFSYGWVFQANYQTYGTVMSYPGQRIPYFSNPSVNFLGVPTGTSSANNAQTLGLTMQTVSSFSGQATTSKAPKISLTSPINNSTADAGENLLLTASVTAGSSPMTRVDFYQDGALIGSSTGPVFSCQLTNPAYGDFTLTARAVDSIGASTLSSPVSVHAQYLNDSFALRRPFTGPDAQVSVGNVGATVEPGESLAYPNTDATIWLTWTAPADGTVLFSIPNRDFVAFTAVYTGNNLTNLQFVIGSPYSEATAFQVQRGVAYQIAIGGHTDSIVSGHATLLWQEFPTISNDNLANAIQIPGTNYHVSADNVMATSEPGEPGHGYYAQGHSVWWRWIAPENGVLSLTTSNGQNVIFGIYLGDTVSNLTQVVLYNSSSLQFSVAAGKMYDIAVDNVYGGYSTFDLGLAFNPGVTPPPNDNFADSIPLAGDNISVLASNIGATRELGEPGGPGNYNTGSGQTVWWSWTAPENGFLTVDPGRNDAYLVAYTGDVITALTNIGDVFGKLSVSVSAGTTYHILLDSTGNPFQTILTFNFVPSIDDLSNDNFSNRAVLTGVPVQVYQFNGGATKEPGEPNHGDNPGGQSLWYTWTSTFDGDVLIKVESQYERFDSLLGVYTGDSLTSLRSIGQGSSQIQLTVTNGMTLQIAVDGYNGFYGIVGATAHYILTIQGPPANDNFSARQVVSGSNVVVKSSTLLASKEPGEPNHGLQPGGSSVWYSWTAPKDGAVKLRLTDFTSPLLGVYTGNSVGALTPVQSTWVMPIDFNVTAGTTYQVAVDASSAPGSFTLTLAFDSTIVRPANDDFANRIPISGFTEVFGSNTNATREYGEPYRQIVQGNKSVWWEWTSPVTGQVTIDPSRGVIGSIGVFSGTQLTNLVEIIYTLGGPVTFDSVAGAKYQIVVDSYEGWGGIPYGSIDLVIYRTPPWNDDFANRGMLYGASPSGTVSNEAATRELSEPDHAGAGIGRSVWWSWTAPASGLVSINSGQGSCLAVYTGDSLANLTSVASNAVTGQLTLNAVSGETYQIAIDSINSNAIVGSININSLTFNPANDAFSNRVLITGTNFNDYEYSGLASSEPGEPVRGIGKTLWWTWTAPLNGRVRFASSSPYALTSVFLGDAVSNLTLVVAGFSMVDFTAVAGTIYQISVDSSIPNGAGNFSCSLIETPEPLNDDFANATPIQGLPVSSTGSNLGATLEPSEPRLIDTNCVETVWWKWTAPISARTSLQISGQTADFFQGFSTVFVVYTGGALSNLVLVTTGTNSGVFQATGGTTYWFAVDGIGGQEGNLSLHLFRSPPNDNFADRQTLSGYSPHAAGSSAGGTMESGEIPHGIEPETASVWFTWTAPASGTLTINYAGDGFYASASIYTGNSLTSLTRLAGENFNFSFNMPVTKGTTYQIALAGWYGGGNYTLDLNLDAGNSNDAFANRISLAGTNFTVTANNSSATKQSGEPKLLGFPPSHSLWWTYTPPTNGSLRIDFSGVGFTPLIGIYTGSSVSKLKSVTNVLDYIKREIVFNVSPKTNYQISVDGYNNEIGGIFLKFDFQPAPLNDQFTNRLVLPGDLVSTNSNNRGATEEVGEPKHSGLTGNHSLWWTWTAPATENVTLAVKGDAFPVRFAVYGGSTLKTLHPVASNYVENVLMTDLTFTAQKGSNYQIVADSDFANFGAVSLKLNPCSVPANDNFADALALQGSTVSATGSNVGATREAGEPHPGTLSPNHSVWWKWTAPVNGPVAVDTFGSSFDTVLAVYTGTAITNLTPMASNDDAASGGVTSGVTFDAVAGRTYFVGIDGLSGASGDIHLNLVSTQLQPLQIDGIRISEDRHFTFQIHGTPSQFFLLQSSKDLVRWESVSTNQCTDSIFEVAEPANGSAEAKFYRVLPWP